MEGFENQHQRGMDRWSVAEWKQAVLEADTEKRLAPFNDVLSGKETHPDWAKNLVLKDVQIGGKNCVVYHWDQEDGQKVPNRSYNRIFVHIKE